MNLNAHMSLTSQHIELSLNPNELKLHTALRNMSMQRNSNKQTKNKSVLLFVEWKNSIQCIQFKARKGNVLIREFFVLKSIV